MTDSNKQIVEACAELMAELSDETKKEVPGALRKLFMSDFKNNNERFYASFGSFPDDRSAEDIIAEIKASRSFRESGWSLSLDNSIQETKHLLSNAANRERLRESLKQSKL